MAGMLALGRGVPGRQPGAHVAAGHRKAPGVHAHAADPADEAGDPSDALRAQAGIGEIMAALDALPAALAETVRLAWLHELPYAEIAQVTDVPVGTVKSRVSRARALMQETLGGRL